MGKVKIKYGTMEWFGLREEFEGNSKPTQGHPCYVQGPLPLPWGAPSPVPKVTPGWDFGKGTPVNQEIFVNSLQTTPKPV